MINQELKKCPKIIRNYVQSLELTVDQLKKSNGRPRNQENEGDYHKNQTRPGRTTNHASLGRHFR